jgi:hypothetical protein
MVRRKKKRPLKRRRAAPFRSHGSTAGKHRWRYPTTLAAMELLRSGYFLDAAERCRAWRVEGTIPMHDGRTPRWRVRGSYFLHGAALPWALVLLELLAVECLRAMRSANGRAAVLRGGRVDRSLAQRLEPDAVLAEPSQQVQQIPRRARCISLLGRKQRKFDEASIISSAKPEHSPLTGTTLLQSITEFKKVATWGSILGWKSPLLRTMWMSANSG